MKIRFTIVALILIALIGGLAYFQFVLKPAMISEYMASQPQPSVSVNAAKAGTTDWVGRIPSIGTLRAVQGVDVTSEASGIVTTITFESGNTVKEGELLVQIDDSVEQAELKSNQAARTRAHLAWKRRQTLFEKGTVAQSQLDEARAGRDEADAAVERTRAVIEQKSVEAPFSGRLGIRKIDIGQYVPAGTAMVSLQMLDPIYVDFPVPEQSVDRIASGANVEVRVDTYPGEVFKGTVESVDSRVERETRTLLVRAKLANPDNKLLPGMFANVAVLAGEPTQVVTVPRTAVTYSLYGDTVYVLTPSKDGDSSGTQHYTAKREIVEPGEAQGDKVVIRKGIDDGDLVVTSGQLKLHPGVTVTVDGSGGLKPPAEMPRE